MFADEFKRTCNITIKPLRVTFGYTCPNVTEAVRLHSLLQPKKAFQPIGSSQFWGVPIFSPWHTNSSWRRKNKKAIKKLWPISCFFFVFFLTIISFRCRFAKYLLVHLLPLLPIRILWKLHVVITVTIVTRVVGPLLQRLLGDGLGPPVLLVVGLAALGVRLVKHICLPFPADVTSTVALNSTGTAAPLWLEWDAPPSSTTPGTAEGQTSLGIATPATWWWSSPSSGWGRPPPAGTSATAPHAVHVIITIIRVFISSTVIVIVVTIVIVIVVFVSIIVWRVSITPSTPTPSAPAWWGHTWRRVIIVIVIPGERRTALHSWNCAREQKLSEHVRAPSPPCVPGGLPSCLALFPLLVWGFGQDDLNLLSSHLLPVHLIHCLTEQKINDTKPGMKHTRGTSKGLQGQKEGRGNERQHPPSQQHPFLQNEQTRSLSASWLAPASQTERRFFREAPPSPLSLNS